MTNYFSLLVRESEKNYLSNREKVGRIWEKDKKHKETP